MVLIKLTCILQFSIPKKVVTDKKGKKKSKSENSRTKSKTSKSKSSKSRSSKSKKSKESDTANVSTKPLKEKKLLEEHVIEVGKPIAYVHVDYELIPKKFKYEFDVICWGSVVKVFTVDGCHMYRTVSTEDIFFAYIPIEHRCTFSDEDLLILQNHVIKFNISTKKNKLQASAKMDKSKFFYLRKEDVSCQSFIQVFDIDPNIMDGELSEKDRKRLEIKRYIEDLLWSCINGPTEEEVTSCLHYDDNLHEHIVNDVVQKVINGEEIVCKPFAPHPTPEMTDTEKEQTEEVKQAKKNKKAKKSKKSATSSKTSKKSGKSKKSKQDKKKAPHFLIPAETFFTEPNLATFRMNDTNEPLVDGFLLTSCDSLLTYPQKFSLNPFIIKIMKLECFPYDYFTKLGYGEIFASCEIPSLCKFNTQRKSMSDTVHFNESHVYFTEDRDRVELYEFMQTQRLLIEIKAEKPLQSYQKEANIFSTEKSDVALSKRMTSKFCEIKMRNMLQQDYVTLMVASFDISFLLKKSMVCQVTEQCHAPNSMLYTKPQINETFPFIEVVNISEVNFSKDYEKILGYETIPEGDLITRGTALKISVSVMAPQFASIYLHKSIHTFKRFFATVMDCDIGRQLFNEVFIYNQEIMGERFMLGDLIPHCDEFHKNDEEEVNYGKLITGFIIDNGNEVIFYLEGPSDGYIMTLWNQLYKLTPPKADVFLNTDYVFQSRLYPQLLTYYPVLPITMKIPLQDIFSNPLTFITGNIPPPCFECHILSSVRGDAENMLRFD